MKRLFAILLLMAFFVPALLTPSDASSAGLTVLDKPGLEKLVLSKKQPMLVTFFATWCPPCRKEVPELVSVAETNKGRFAVVGLSVDEPSKVAEVEAFMKKYKVNYPVYLASPDLVADFGISSIPFNVFYDAKGKIRLAGAGSVDRAEIEDSLGQLQNKGK